MSIPPLSLPFPTYIISCVLKRANSPIEEEAAAVQKTRAPGRGMTWERPRNPTVSERGPPRRHAAPNWVLKVATRRLSCRRKLIKIAVIGPLPRTLFSKGRSGGSETEPGLAARAGRLRSKTMQMNHSPPALKRSRLMWRRPHASPAAQEVLPNGTDFESKICPRLNFTLYLLLSARFLRTALENKFYPSVSIRYCE